MSTNSTAEISIKSAAKWALIQATIKLKPTPNKQSDQKLQRLEVFGEGNKMGQRLDANP